MSEPKVPSPGALLCVTGANGFIASYLIRELLTRGYRVRGTVRDPSSEAKTAHLRAIAAEAGAEDRLELVAADLLEEGSFDAAIAGCEGVFHCAAAVFLAAEDPQRDIVDPSLIGTRNVLSAAARAGTVRRVVHTSSVAAVISFGEPASHRFTEADWNDTSTVANDAYGYAKVSAERAALEQLAELPEDARFDLVHLHPGFVFGPPLIKAHAKASPSLIRDVLTSTRPGVPPIHMAFVDVRDVALAHVLAMERPDMPARTLLVSEHLWLPEVARRLQQLFPELKITTRRLPRVVVLAAALFDKSLSFRQLRHVVARSFTYDTSRARDELGIRFRPGDETLRDTAAPMIEHGWARVKRRSG